MTTPITITLTGGTSPIYANRHGVCDDGAYWTEFDVDYLAEQIDGQCEMCNKTINNGWRCHDGGEEACNECVKIIQPE